MIVYIEPRFLNAQLVVSAYTVVILGKSENLNNNG